MSENAADELDSPKNVWQTIGIFAVAALYVAARLWGLIDSCLWFDEIFSVHAALHDWSGLLEFIRLDLIHPPLFYALLKIWIALGGESLWWLRMFPVFWSLIAIAPFLLLCRELKLTQNEILLAFLLLAVNGSLIKYAQEVRMYSLLFCLALFSFWLFVKFLNSGSKTVSLLLLLVNLLLIYTHYFGWLVVLAEFAAILILKKDKLRRFLLLTAVWGLSFLPWAWAVYSAKQTGAGFGQNLGWAAKPGLLNTIQFFLQLNEPFYSQLSSIDPTNLLLVAAPVALISLAAIGLNWRNEKIQLTAILLLVPFIAALFMSLLLPFSVWGVRHLIIVAAAYSIIVAVAVNRLRSQNLKIAALCLLGTFVLIGGIARFSRSSPNFIWCAWEPLAQQAIETNKNENVTIYAFEDLVAYHLWFAAKNDSRFRVVAVKNYPGMPEDAAYFLPRGFDDVKAIDANGITSEKFWLAFRDPVWKPEHPLLRDLTARGYKIGQPLEIRAQGASAFLVPASKENVAASDP